MARLNIEDPFWLEVMQVISAIGDTDKAIGNAIRFFRFAQEKHKSGALISEDEFKRQGFLESLIPIFAERVEGGIKAVGADKHFGWLTSKVEAGRAGGRVSAQRARDEKGQLLPKNAVEVQAESKQTPSTAKHHQASSSPSYSVIEEDPNGSSSSDGPKESGRRSKKPKVELWQPKTPDELLEGMTADKRKAWAELYPDPEFIRRTAIKAFAYYCHDSPADQPRTRKGWSKALNYWLDKGWLEYVRATAPRNQGKPIAGRTPYAPAPPPSPPQDPAVDPMVDRILAAIEKHGRRGYSDALAELPPEFEAIIEDAGGWGNLDAYSLDDRRKHLRMAVMRFLGRVGNQTSAGGNREKAAQAQNIAAGLAGTKTMPQAPKENFA